MLTLSEQKVTARYYASQHNFSELAVRLAALEAAEEATVTAARSSTEAPANRVFCPHCRQYVRKDSRLLVLCRQMASGEVKSDNAYVTEFIGMPCCQRLASDVLYHSLANCSHLRKEISTWINQSVCCVCYVVASRIGLVTSGCLTLARL